MLTGTSLSNMSFLACHVANLITTRLVFTDHLYRRPQVELEKILSYLSIDYDRVKLARVAPEFQARLKAFLEVDVDEANIPAPLFSAGVSALKYEWESTHGLTGWPCKSFKNPEGDAFLTLKPPQLAANCSAPFVT